MSIVNRLGDLFRSYFTFDDDFDEGSSRVHGDPDIDEAWAELNEFMGSTWTGKTRDWEDPYRSRAGERQNSGTGPGNRGGPPERLRSDFAELGVAFGADEETCKAAYKKLLKVHHPDRHAGHEGNMKKATAKSSRINAAYENIRRWRSNTG
ncbi:MAG: J domain-containing protein [Spirochaetaceae bacterium]|nr:J domain-containing protein [Spirochaetaceae bacterium]